MVVALNDFQEECGTVFDRHRKDLQQIAMIIIIDEDVKLLQNVQGLLDGDLGRGEVGTEGLVVGRGHGEELGPARPQRRHSRNDIVRVQGNVLHARAAVIVDKLLDLTLAFSGSRLIKRHLDLFIDIGHDDGAKGAVFGKDLRIIDAPETMKGQLVFVHVAGRHHLQIALISDTMVHKVEFGVRKQGEQWVDDYAFLKVRQEKTAIILSLHKRVDGIAVLESRRRRSDIRPFGQSMAYRSNAGHDYLPIGILFSPRLTHHLGTPLHGFLENGQSGCFPGETHLEDKPCIVHGKGNIADTITMFGNVRIHHLFVREERTLKDKEYLVLFHHVTGHLAMSSFQTAICDGFEAEARRVKRGCLSCIPHPKDYVVKAEIFASFRHR